MNKVDKKCKFIMLLLFFTLMFIYADISWANNSLAQITEVKYFSRADRNIIVADQFNNSFKVKFLLRKGVGCTQWSKAPVVQEFIIFDDKGVPYVGKIEKNDQICDIWQSARNYACILQAHFAQKKTDVSYQNLMLKIEDGCREKIDVIKGKMPELGVKLEKIGIAGGYNTLVLRNNHAERIRIISVQDGNYMVVVNKDWFKAISLNEIYKIELKSKNCSSNKKYFEDAIKIKYMVAGAESDDENVLDGEIGLVCSCDWQQEDGRDEIDTTANQTVISDKPLLVVQNGRSFAHLSKGASRTIWYTIKNTQDEVVKLSVSEFAPSTFIYRDHSVEEDCDNSLDPGEYCSVKLLIYPTQSGIIESNLVILPQNKTASPYVTKKINISVSENNHAVLLQITPVTDGNELGSIYNVICDKMVNIPSGYGQTDFDSICKGSDQQTMQLEYLFENKSTEILEIISSNVFANIYSDDPAFRFIKQCRQLKPGDICKMIIVVFDGGKGMYRTLSVWFTKCYYGGWWCDGEKRNILLPILISRSDCFRE